MTKNIADAGLPPLPKPARYFGHSVSSPMFDKEEMTSYAVAAIAAEREATNAELRREAALEADLDLDAKRWRFFVEHWNSTMGGVSLHRWIAEQTLRLGGPSAALDYAMNYHTNGERHIA
jgi:hypothetical protein